MGTGAAVPGTGTEMAVVQDKAIVKIRRADPEAAAGQDVHSPAETMRGKAVAAEGAYCREQHPEGEYCRTGRVEQVSRRTEDSPGCGRDPTWFQGCRLTLVEGKTEGTGGGVTQRDRKKQRHRARSKKDITKGSLPIPGEEGILDKPGTALVAVAAERSSQQIVPP